LIYEEKQLASQLSYYSEGNRTRGTVDKWVELKCNSANMRYRCEWSTKTVGVS